MGSIIIPILWVRKPKHRENEYLAQSSKAEKWQSLTLSKNVNKTDILWSEFPWKM